MSFKADTTLYNRIYRRMTYVRSSMISKAKGPKPLETKQFLKTKLLQLPIMLLKFQPLKMIPPKSKQYLRRILRKMTIAHQINMFSHQLLLTTKVNKLKRSSANQRFSQSNSLSNPSLNNSLKFNRDQYYNLNQSKYL